MRRRLPPVPAIAGALLLLALVVGLAPWVGRSGFGQGGATWHLFFPRAVLGALAGVGLALCGTVLQSVLRNPLADPYTLGLSSGAAVGAAAALQLPRLVPSLHALLERAPGLDLPATFGGAFAGSLLASGLVYGIASRRALAAESLLLAGVAVALFAGALLSVLHYVASTIDLIAVMRWSMGTLSTVGWRRVWLLLPPLVVGAAALLALLRRLDVASLDDESARGLGVDPVRVRKLAFLGASLVTAGVVAAAGPIGFVGLVVPHATRALVGPDPRVLVPCAACLGGALLVGCDLLARTLLPATDLPINVITHAIGCPAFVWILVRRR